MKLALNNKELITMHVNNMQPQINYLYANKQESFDEIVLLIVIPLKSPESR